MNILLTNDDGVFSDGLQLLAKALRLGGKHRVIVAAPHINRSGVSHSLSILHNPVKLALLEEDTWSCTGTPADCVMAALKCICPERPDLVISGINHGENTGTDIVYSGTAAAARQASFSGIPALAFSLAGYKNHCWDMAVPWVLEHLEELKAIWRQDCFVNVNIPNREEGPAGMAMTWPAIKCYTDSLEMMNAPDGSRWCFLLPGQDKTVKQEGSDSDALSRNLVSVSLVYNYPIVRE